MSILLNSELTFELNNTEEKERQSTHTQSLDYTVANKLLQDALKNGIINLDDVQDQMTKKHREEILKLHPYEIWQGKDLRYRTYIPDTTQKSGRKMIVKTHETDLINYLVSYYDALDESKQLENISLESLYPQWLKYKELHTTAPTYISRIGNYWDKYYLNSDIIKNPIRKLDKLTLDEWAHQLIKDNNMSKKVYYNSTVIMRQALQYATDLNIIEKSPFEAVAIDGKRLFKQDKKKPDYTQVFLKNEVAAIESMAWEDFHNNLRRVHRLAPLAILFQFQTGLRLGELTAIRYEDIETSDCIHIQRMYRPRTKEVVEHTKNHIDRKVVLTDKAKRLIHIAKEFQEQQGTDSNGYIFSDDGNPLSDRSVSYLYTKYCNQLGIIHKSSHKSRKTYISALIDGHVNINTIREMVGHADERTTFGNYCFDRSTNSEKAQLIENALCN